MITVDTRPYVREVNNLTKNITFEEYRKANARAINHTIGKAKTAANKAIRATYKIPQAQAAKSMTVVRATPQSPVGMLKASSGFTPFHAFQPTMTTTTGAKLFVTKQGALASKAKRLKRGGTGVMMIEIVKGKKRPVRSAFFLPGASKGLVTARGQYSGNSTFNWRHRRIQKDGPDNPIDALRTISVFKAVTMGASQNILFNELGKDYQNRLVHELSRNISTR